MNSGSRNLENPLSLCPFCSNRVLLSHLPIEVYLLLGIPNLLVAHVITKSLTVTLWVLEVFYKHPRDGYILKYTPWCNQDLNQGPK